MPQLSVPAVYVRGGTSRALVFRAQDLPEDARLRDAIILAALGSPDPNKRQLDGLGGAISSLSKVAIVAPASRPDADVDYTFGQVAIDAPIVGYRGNCGNISAAIGPFAVDEGMVATTGDTARVRIHNTNTGKIIVSDFPLQDGRAAVDGDFELPGVAGTGAPVRLSFLDPGGAVTGRLLPTGAPVERLDLPGFGAIAVSLVDAANPVVFVAADTLGLDGTERPSDLEQDAGLMKAFEDLRVAAALRMGIAADEDEARRRVRNLPQVGIVSRPATARTASGGTICADDVHITTRMISAGQPHRASPLTGAMCLAVAMRIAGTLPHGLARPSDEGRDMIIGHPSGTLPVAARVTNGPEPHAREAVVYRTSRRLMEGRVLVPRSALGRADT
ncbi:2-methylaconitate cis-trans isomerase PrpF family protein [Labrys wisconsinensis]|uniref:2-methylaconitate cis-trans-isomerase PrpF n=1 Tax=Labrys wisconsinensis TaxID=425677 RepID=A0ABU0JLR9_9HYPH|nr:PrpF domain-containing protein [Labrys wisconsinensis]MDQ0475224.1 2-methylaconitate cis-trans-isomerase PrpF [Labrys wisconsinensis]